MSRSRKRRELSRLITQRKQAVQWEALRRTQAGLSRALDNLNAFGLLEDVQRHPPGSLMCFGPKSIHGGADPAWVGVVVWMRRPGYHHFDMLSLLGVWAEGIAESGRIIAGTRTLQYTGQPYNAESYFHHLKRDFSLHYGKDVPPPTGAGRLYERVYAPDARLEMRRELEAMIDDWRGRYV